MRGIGSVSVLVEPRAEPLSLVEAKAHLRVTTDDEDTLISALITATRNWTEAYLRRALVLQTVQMVLDQFEDEIRLDRFPLMKWGALKYTDANGVLQTLDPSVYQVDSYREPGRLTRAYAQVWPQLRGGEDLNSVYLSYQAGYLAPVEAVDSNANTLQVVNNPFADGDVVYPTQSGGAVPAGLTEDRPYYVVGTSGETLQLSLTSGGSAVDITDAGTGSIFVAKRRLPKVIVNAMKLMLAHWFVNREAVNVGNIVTEVPLGVKNVLAPYRLVSFQ